MLATMIAAVDWFAPSPAVAQGNQKGSPPPAWTLAGRPTLTAVRVEEPPSIDGRLDDPIWRTATRVTEFVQRRPVEGAPPTEQTEVYVAYDSQKIYFGIYAHYTDPSLIRANRVDRDQIRNDDKVAVYLDPFLDQQRAYAFSVNPYGVQRDGLLTASGGPGQDNSWNALFDAAATLAQDGWTAEMAIPFKSLRYPERRPGETHRWGIQLERDVESKNEALVWSPVSSNVLGFISQMGVLEGLTSLSTSRNLEVLPTLTAIQVGNLDRTTGAYMKQDVAEGGLNVKYGITSNLTFDFTFNPDFSQIESDRPQIEVNQRFPILFPELRPFFLEGQEIYSIPGPVRLVHTRTVVDPRYGAKLTGKLGRTALAVLVADDEAPGKVEDRASPAFERSAYVVAARAKIDLYSQSHIGAIFTNREFLDSYSRLGGVDGGFRLGPSHMLTFRAIGSDRRDQNDVRNTGPQWNVAFQRQARNFTYSVDHYRTHPDFRTDLGFVRRVDERKTTINASYKWWPESWIVSWGPGFNYQRSYDYRGATLQDETSGGSVDVQFAKYINMGADVNRVMERYRGIDFHKTRFLFSGSVNTSNRISFSAAFDAGDEIRFIANPYLGRTTAYQLSATLRPFSRLQSTINLDMNRFEDVRTNTQVFNVKILHSVTTYQFTDRLLVRNILDHNTLDKTVAASVLVTYRVNAGTVFFAGYNDSHRQGNMVNSLVFPTSEYQRTNRAMFMKLQYLFRR